MGSLVSLLQQLQTKLERFRKEGLKETPTRMIFVDPILECLGWDVRDPDEVQLEYPTIDNKSVDYALKINRSPVLLVEAKGLIDPLRDVKDVTQTTGYAANDGIVWCILTNGVRWRVYRSVEKCPAPEKLMYEVSYDPADLEGISLEQVAEQFRRFSREEMARGTLDVLGEQTFTDGKVRKALASLIAEPPTVLLKLVRRSTADDSIRPQTVKDSLKRVLAPLLGAATHSRPIPLTLSDSRRNLAASKLSKAQRTQKGSGYSEKLHIDGKPREILELYQRLDQYCLGLRNGGIEKNFLAKYIAYRDGKRIFCCVHLQLRGMRVWLKTNFDRLQNPPKFARDVSNVGHWGVGNVELDITNLHQLIEAEPIVKQAFEAP